MQRKWYQALRLRYISCPHPWERFLRIIGPEPNKSKMTQKQPKLKVIIYTFRLSHDPSTGSLGVPPRDMGGH